MPINPPVKHDALQFNSAEANSAEANSTQANSTQANSTQARGAEASHPQSNTEKILCPHCLRTATNGIKCQGICVADSDY